MPPKKRAVTKSRPGKVSTELSLATATTTMDDLNSDDSSDDYSWRLSNESSNDEDDDDSDAPSSSRSSASLVDDLTEIGGDAGTANDAQDDGEDELASKRSRTDAEPVQDAPSGVVAGRRVPTTAIPWRSVGSFGTSSVHLGNPLTTARQILSRSHQVSFTSQLGSQPTTVTDIALMSLISDGATFERFMAALRPRLEARSAAPLLLESAVSEVLAIDVAGALNTRHRHEDTPKTATSTLSARRQPDIDSILGADEALGTSIRAPQSVNVAELRQLVRRATSATTPSFGGGDDGVAGSSAGRQADHLEQLEFLSRVNEREWRSEVDLRRRETEKRLQALQRDQQ